MKRLLAIAKLLLATLVGAAALWVLSVVAVLVLPSSWTSARPSDAELLQRHLGLGSTNGFQRVTVMYRPAREWSALFYFKASPEMLSRLLVDQRFEETRTIQTNEFVRMVAFDLAPSPSVVSGAKVFEKRPPEDFVWHFGVVSADGTQLWIRVQRF